MSTPRRGHVRQSQSVAAAIERRRAQVARLVLDGNTHRVIAEELDCSPATWGAGEGTSRDDCDAEW